MVNVFENMSRWFSYAVWLQDRFFVKGRKRTKARRGDIYACYLGQNIGHEISRLEARPCLVVSSDDINRRSDNVVVVPLTKSVRYKVGGKGLKYEWHYVLKQSKYKLHFDSAVLCECIRCISEVRLGRYIDHVDQEDMKNIAKRLKRTLQV